MRLVKVYKRSKLVYPCAFASYRRSRTDDSPGGVIWQIHMPFYPQAHMAWSGFRIPVAIHGKVMVHKDVPPLRKLRDYLLTAQFRTAFALYLKLVKGLIQPPQSDVTAT